MMVCIEGIDAAGKATQSRRLAHRMSGKLFSFPDYTTPIGHMIKGHLSGYWHAAAGTELEGDALVIDPKRLKTIDAVVFQALQLANRMEHAMEISQTIAGGQHVICDRYWPSGVVYGTADGLNSAWLMDLHRWLPQPDVFILLDMDPTMSVERRPARRDRYEKQNGLMQEASGLYRKLWQEQTLLNPLRTAGKAKWSVVDASLTEDEVAQAIWQEVTG